MNKNKTKMIEITNEIDLEQIKKIQTRTIKTNAIPDPRKTDLLFRSINPIFKLAAKYKIDSSVAFKLGKEQHCKILQNKFLQYCNKKKGDLNESQTRILDSPNTKGGSQDNPLGPKFKISEIDFSKFKNFSIIDYIFTAFQPEIKSAIIRSFIVSASSIFLLSIYKSFLEELQSQFKEHNGIKSITILFLNIISIVGLQLAISLFVNHGEVSNSILNKKIKTTLYSLIYNKCLTVDYLNSKKLDMGKISTLFQSDVKQFDTFSWIVTNSVGSVVQITLGISYGFYVFGFSYSLVILPLLFFSYFNKLVFSKWGKLNHEWKRALDMRIGLLKEILGNINFIKAWVLENEFLNRMEKRRLGEIKLILTSTFLIMGFTSLTVFGEILATLIFLGVYLANQNALNVGKMTVLIRSLSIIGNGVKVIGSCFGSYKALRVSSKRIEEFFLSEEWHRESRRIKLKRENSSDNIDLEIINGEFQWAKEVSEDTYETEEQSDMILVSDENRMSFMIDRVNMKLREGNLYLMVGKIGSGKSTVLSAILGDVPSISSRPSIFFNDGKTLSYLSQEPWIINGSVEENIKLGTSNLSSNPHYRLESDFKMEKESERLEYAVKYSCLMEDLEMFGEEMRGDDDLGNTPDWRLGLSRMVGQSGKKLSGGQRARIALARCLYQE